LRQQLYFLRITESKTITNQLTKLNKIIDDLENIEVNIKDEDKTILLLCALPRSFDPSRIPCFIVKTHCYLGGSQIGVENQ